MNDTRRKGLIVRWSLRLLALAVGLLIVGVVAVYLALRPEPILEQATAYPCPDGEWQATMETIDNGMGMGLGVLYYEVHVHRAGTRIRDHGDREPSAAFYIDSQNVIPPRLRWVSARHLVIEYDQALAHNSPGKKLDRVGEIGIEYRRTP